MQAAIERRSCVLKAGIRPFRVSVVPTAELATLTPAGQTKPKRFREQNCASEYKSFADRGRRHGLVTESRGERGHRTPSGAMTGCDGRKPELLHGFDRLRNYCFVRARQMKPAHDCMQRHIRI